MPANGDFYDRRCDLFPERHSILASEHLPITTAATSPQSFSEGLWFAQKTSVAALILALFMVVGFGLRVNQLGTESLGEDELNKLETVREYRENGLSGKNGEHPFLMKGLQTLSVSTSETLNAALGTSISPEAALRFPIALFGTFTALFIFLLIRELFGSSIGLVSAIFWTVEPMAIGFDRVAKEDSLVLFFFLVASYLWVRGQTEAESGNEKWPRYAWGAGAAFSALMASKYYPHLLAILAGYYLVFQYIPATKWRMETKRWLAFLTVMGFAFLVLNPTIVLPETWREMLKFSTENRIGHDSYEFLGELHTNKMSAWLNGVPWTFYYVFIAVKTSLPILLLLLVGLPLMFLRRMGDGRFFVFFWAFFWFLPFTFLGGKFTRYFTFVEPLILIVAATAFYFCATWITEKLTANRSLQGLLQAAFLVAIIGTQLTNALSVAPHYRMFTNIIGGGSANAGQHFPHDEFYDAASLETLQAIAAEARQGVIVACETPGLFEYYSRRIGRPDLRIISLSDPKAVLEMGPDDLVVLTEGRRYRSNSAYFAYLKASGPEPVKVFLDDAVAARIVKLDKIRAAEIKKLAGEPHS